MGKAHLTGYVFDPLLWYVADAAMHGSDLGYGFSTSRGNGYGYGYGPEDNGYGVTHGGGIGTGYTQCYGFSNGHCYGDGDFYDRGTQAPHF